MGGLSQVKGSTPQRVRQGYLGRAARAGITDKAAVAPQSREPRRQRRTCQTTARLRAVYWLSACVPLLPYGLGMAESYAGRSSSI